MVAAPSWLRLRFPPTTLTSGPFLIGGDPVVVLRLTPAARRAVASWRDGLPIGAEFGHLARRLLDDGLVEPALDQAPATPIAIVIPARDAAATLPALFDTLPVDAEVIVVDDGSRDETAAVAEAAGATLVRHPTARGPAAARNSGFAASDAPLVLFVDADTRLEAGVPAALAAEFADPQVAAVGPRVLGDEKPVATLLAAYEAERSPLDLGAGSGRVAPGSRRTYLPSAAMMVRREALAAIGGFDECLHFGEDVDLSWRLGSAGWTLRYQPSAVVRHRHRTTALPAIRRRFRYGTASGGLGRRHPDRVAALTLSPGFAALGVAAARRRDTSVASTAAVSLALSVAKLTGAGLRPSIAARIVVKDHVRQGRAGLFAVTRPWLPATLVLAALSRRARVALVTVVVARHLQEWQTRRPRIGPGAWIALRFLDDAVSAAGLWWGAAAARSGAALGVRLRRPPPSEAGDGWVVVARFG